ncbi:MULTISPECIES: hypothetical protein [Nonomuraea]|nr:hypothetical protein [Nonomuraea africana]MBE1566511.1 hypothetical protein [Nonomuraea africana]
MPAEASGAVTGLWFATRKADHLFYAPGAAGVLLTNILLHEIAHMLLGHGDVGGDAERALRILVEPIVEAFEARRFKARARYDTLEEREAEKLATLLLVRASERRDDGDDEGLRMLSRTFGYER